MLTKDEIIQFCSQHSYDIRESGNGRWIDQKCTADVVCIVADCILNYYAENKEFFPTRDIWHSTYTVECVENIFRKPGVELDTAHSEYDKFFQQPMELLANAGVLEKKKRDKENIYRVINYDVLEFIALRDLNALFFLQTYIEKVLQDSGIYNVFEDFFRLQTKAAFTKVKNAFLNFTISNTKINGKKECNRIFIKVLNPLAYYHHCKGTERGYMSNEPITYDMLVYNKKNFRDLYSNKPKGITRKEYALAHPEINVGAIEAYYRYQSIKAKRYLRLFNDRYRDGKTEHLDGVHVYEQAVHMHHIFPEAEYPEICYYLENLIALTPAQHLSYAHPNGRTQEIDEQYQHLLLLSKADRIRENLEGQYGERIYEFDNFIYVLNTGFDNDVAVSIPTMDFEMVVDTINLHYANRE